MGGLTCTSLEAYFVEIVESSPASTVSNFLFYSDVYLFIIAFLKKFTCFPTFIFLLSTFRRLNNF